MKSKDYFRAIQIVHLALVAGILFFVLISVFMQANAFGTMDDESNNLLMVFALAFAAIGIASSKILFKRKVRKCNANTTLAEKLDEYRSALIIKFASLEAPSFLSIVIYLLTGNTIVLIIAGVLIIVFIMYRPTKEKLIGDLELDTKEKALINNPEAIVATNSN